MLMAKSQKYVNLLLFSDLLNDVLESDSARQGLGYKL